MIFPTEFSCFYTTFIDLTNNEMSLACTSKVLQPRAVQQIFDSLQIILKLFD